MEKSAARSQRRANAVTAVVNFVEGVDTLVLLTTRATYSVMERRKVYRRHLMFVIKLPSLHQRNRILWVFERDRS